jgi:hypothetical protein
MCRIILHVSFQLKKLQKPVLFFKRREASCGKVPCDGETAIQLPSKVSFDRGETEECSACVITRLYRRNVSVAPNQKKKEEEKKNIIEIICELLFTIPFKKRN